jgi:hypothetical protein
MRIEFDDEGADSRPAKNWASRVRSLSGIKSEKRLPSTTSAATPRKTKQEGFSLRILFSGLRIRIKSDEALKKLSNLKGNNAALLYDTLSFLRGWWSRKGKKALPRRLKRADF